MSCGEGRGDAGQRGVRTADRAVPARVAGALLPDARLGLRRRGPGAGDPGPGLAVLQRLPGQVVAADLAVPDRHQRLPAGDREPCPAAAAVGPGCPGRRPGPADPAAVTVSRESVRLALIAALQYLPGRQRAVLILRDVLGWHAAEVAELLGITPTAVNSLLQRARARLRQAAPATDEVREPAEASERTLLNAYAEAFASADVGALAKLLRD